MKNINRSTIGKKLKENRHLLILLYYFFVGLMYLYVNRTILPENIQVIMRLPEIDNRIPFVKYMVIPYYIWYPYIIIPLLYFAFTEKQTFIRMAVFLFGGSTLAYIFFILVPNGIGVGFRPVITDTDIFSRMISSIYAIDEPANSCPSIHVLNSIAVHSAIYNSDRFKGSWMVKFSGITAALICSSTVMIKQHSVIDVTASVIVGAIMYYFIYGKTAAREKLEIESEKV